MEKRSLIHSLLRMYSIVLVLMITIAIIIVNLILAEGDKANAIYTTQQSANRIADILSENDRRLTRIANDLVSNQREIDDLNLFFQLDFPEYLQKSLEINRENITDFVSFPRAISNLYLLYEDISSITLVLNDFEDIFYSNTENPMGIKTQRMPVKNNEIMLSRLFRDPNTWRNKGIIYMTVYSDEIEQVIKNNSGDFQLEVIIFNNSYQQLYQSQESLSEIQQQFIKSYGGIHSEVVSTKFEETYHFSIKTARNGYQVLTFIPKRQVRRQSVERLGILLLGGICLEFILLYMLRRTFKKYIIQVEDIVNSANKVTGDKMTFRINENNKKGELKEISKSINQMLDSINQYIEDIYKLEIKQRDANMEALQAQINPHFLYNTLEYIRMYAVSEGEDELADIVFKFGSLMRNNISQEKTTTLKRELEFCEKYIQLYQIRYPECISYSFQVDQQLAEMEIPKFILQPLIENYLVHGIDYSRVDNAIEVNVIKGDEKNTIIIKDNGVGMNDDKLNKVKDVLKSKQVKLGESIGITNVNERLSLYFQNNYEMNLERNEEGGITIFIYF